MARDAFSNARDLSQPLTRSSAVVPADADLPEIPRAVFVQTGGDLVIRLADDATDWTLTVEDGSLLPFRVKRVAAATTATGIRALF